MRPAPGFGSGYGFSFDYNYQSYLSFSSVAGAVEGPPRTVHAYATRAYASPRRRPRGPVPSGHATRASCDAGAARGKSGACSAAAVHIRGPVSPTPRHYASTNTSAPHPLRLASRLIRLSPPLTHNSHPPCVLFPHRMLCLRDELPASSTWKRMRSGCRLPQPSACESAPPWAQPWVQRRASARPSR